MATATHPLLTAVFRDRQDARQVYDWLESRGYTSNDINLLMSDKTSSAFLTEAERNNTLHTESKLAEGVATGGAVGTALGATIAAVAAIGTTVMIPGLNLLVAGSVLAGLAGAGAGAITGGLVGGLIGLGIPESNAHAYEAVLKDGGVAIGVRPHDSDEAKAIRDYFGQMHGENIVEAAG